MRLKRKHWNIILFEFFYISQKCTWASNGENISDRQTDRYNVIYKITEVNRVEYPIFIGVSTYLTGWKH
jgi:hypothetical protein